MKISIIGSRGYPYVYSGYETFVKELAERLVKYNIDVTVYCHKNLFTSYPKIVNSINLVYIPTIEEKSLSQFIHSLFSIIHTCIKRCDIILVVNSANGIFGLVTRLFKIKTAINVDGLEWLRPKWKGLGSKYFYYASKIATHFYDEIIADSNEMAKIYKNEFRTNSSVICYGANIKQSNKPELIERWNLIRREYYLVVGRLIPDNNSDIIIREFIKSNSCKKLVIVGDVPYKDKYADKIKVIRDSRIIFTGYVYDQDCLSELFCNCLAYIHGHEYGGTNPTMLQALASGCAILALDTKFTREMLDNGRYGLFFNKADNDLNILINNIENNEDLLDNLRKISRNRIVENYTWEKITEQYLSLFNKMTHKNSSKLVYKF